MSAESSHHHQSRTNVRQSGGCSSASSVTPQQVTDPSILDSVAGFINEVVPTAYNVPAEIDDKIQWAHFEQLDAGCASGALEGDGTVPAPIVLVLGYSTGIQVWAIPATGEATEILSWRHSILRVVKFIPTPYKTGTVNNVDIFAHARPLLALCDSTANYTTLTFRSLKSGVVDPVKQIQFKSAILNVLANRNSVVVTFQEKIAVFDSFNLECRVTITTCYLSPGVQQNPIALGARWLAYADKKLVAANRSGGGNESEGVQSYTATVLHAAKSLGRGLKELTETVAGSLTGNQNFKPGSPQAGAATAFDVLQKGIVTILDIESKSINTKENTIPGDAMIAHFVAHTEAIVCLSFDPSGTLLLTSDKRGHDFHLFRIQPHPAGPALAAVHHLYILHRGDTSAKVQDMCFSPDSRWITVSTLRGTTHVFPVTPYGGAISVRTHATPHVVNKMSRYQRSAGLTSDGRSSSPVAMTEVPVSLFPYRNARMPPYPQPAVVHALAQIRQPVYVVQNALSTSPRLNAGRQRLSSSSEENIALRVVGCFAPPRAWMDTTNKTAGARETTLKTQTRPMESLFIMSCYGILVQYDLEPRPCMGISKEKICNDSPIELKVVAKAQWPLHRSPKSADIQLPMSEECLALLGNVAPPPLLNKARPDHNDDHWLSQVEIVTHLGPHRRLWMGPQFTFKTYTISNGTVLETKPVDVRRSKPVNMPISKANAILIESGSASSCEQLFLDTYHKTNEEVGSAGETRLKEDLADAMLESPGLRDQDGHCVLVSVKPSSASTAPKTAAAAAPPATVTVAKVVNPLGTVVTVQSDEQQQLQRDMMSADLEAADAVIHANCDEALFRPVVAPKAIFYAANNAPLRQCPPEHILTKSLEVNTEVAVKIINANQRSHKKVQLGDNKSGEEPNEERKKKRWEVDESKSTTTTVFRNDQFKVQESDYECGKGENTSTELTSKDVEDVSSASSFSSASRASPTPSYSDNLLHFPGDSSSSM